jgi:hypothetical protein
MVPIERHEPDINTDLPYPSGEDRRYVSLPSFEV